MFTGGGGCAGCHGDLGGGVGSVVWGRGWVMRSGRVGAGTGREDCRGQRGANGGGRDEMEVRNRSQMAKKGGKGLGLGLGSRSPSWRKFSPSLSSLEMEAASNMINI